MHGGLVGGWFLIQQCFIEVTSDVPNWLIGSGEGANTNPLGGLVAISILSYLIFIHLKAVAIAREPSNGAFNASSSGDTP